MIKHIALGELPRSALASALAMALFGGGISPAFAQDDDTEQVDEQVDDPANLEEVIVTGTRIRRNDFTAPNATSVITAEDMRNLGATNVAEMINQLPNNIATQTPETGTDSAFFLGASIANLRGLNTYFGTRTLTLVDSRRFVATNSGGGVDLNVIPSALVGRIETVTGGASATYGADALAGVVNVLLDRNMDGFRVDISQQTTDAGDGDNFSFSIAGGTELLDGRGHITVGVEHQKQDGIHDCTTREFCQVSRGIINNGTASAGGFFAPPPPPYSVRNSGVTEPDQPQRIITEGLRFATPSTGLMWNGAVDDVENGVVVEEGRGYFTFNEAGNDIVPLYTDLTEAELDFLRSEGSQGDTPFGVGELLYKGVALIPETTRESFYTRFAYELESGIEVNAEVSYGQNDSFALQNSVRQSFDIAGIEVYPENAYLQLASQRMQDEIMARMVEPCNSVVGPYTGDTDGDFFFTGAYEFTDDVNPACYAFEKHWAGQTEQRNDTKTTTKRVVIGANGDLFGDKWTWDTYFQWGNSHTSTFVGDWASQNRRMMALDAVLDPNTGVPVCRVLYDDPADPNDMGDLQRAKWLNYFDVALGEEDDSAEAQVYLDSLSQGCAPLNAFGHGMSQEARAYAFPGILEGSDITDRTLSVNFSGELWRGLGAGPLQMAAGIDARESETVNFNGDDPLRRREFWLNYGDAWAGRTRNAEIFTELELPLLRDKVAANYLMINVADRRTQNKTERLVGTPASATRYQTSWKVSMVWQPVELMRVRMTRSSDTRAPAPRELYRTFSPSTTTNSTIDWNNPFKTDDPNTPADETLDQFQWSADGGNAGLDQETSISETVGLVFTPTGGVLQGLQASVDYYETTIKGGIASLNYLQVLGRCQDEAAFKPEEEWLFCPNIVFGPPDPNEPNNPYSNIDLIQGSQINEEPYWSRGIDYSVSYFTQLSGGGTLSARLLATRYLEQNVEGGTFFGRVDVSGQTGSPSGDGTPFFPNYTPTPTLSGNMFLTWAKNAFSVTGQVRYVGSGRLTKQGRWIHEGEVGSYVDPVSGEAVYVPYAVNLTNTVSDADLPSWATLNLNFNYDFGRSNMTLNRFDSLSAYMNIENVANRIPDFYSGEGAGGLNTRIFSGLGRQIRLGVRMEF